MERALEITLLIGLTLTAIFAWGMNILGMPGNWLVVASGAGTYLWSSPERSFHVGLVPLSVMVSVAILGELLEFAAGALGASRLGASKRASLLAIAGATLGAIAGLIAGTILPIPLVGSVLGSLMIGALGAAAGAVGGELWAGRTLDRSVLVGHAAFWGRLLGTVGKVVCGTFLCLVFIITIWS